MYLTSTFSKLPLKGGSGTVLDSGAVRMPTRQAIFSGSETSELLRYVEEEASKSDGGKVEGIPKAVLPALSPYTQVKISQSQGKAFQGDDISGSGHFRQRD